MKLREEMAAVGLRERTRAADHELADKHAHLYILGLLAEFPQLGAARHEQRYEQTESREESRSSETEWSYMEVMERMRLEMVAMHQQAQQGQERMDILIREREALHLADLLQKQQAIDQLTKMMSLTLERFQSGSGATVAGGAPPPPSPGGGGRPRNGRRNVRAKPKKVTPTFAAGPRHESPIELPPDAPRASASPSGR